MVNHAVVATLLSISAISLLHGVEQAEDPIISYLRNVDRRIATFEVSFRQSSKAEDMIEAPASGGRTSYIFKRPYRQRMEVQLDEGTVQDVGQDKEGVVDYFSDSEGHTRRADICRPTEILISDYRLFPLQLHRVLESASCESIRREETFVEIAWSHPTGPLWERLIIARFTKDPPHDVLSVTTGPDKEHISTEIRFSSYADLANSNGIRFPTRSEAVWFRDGKRRISEVSEADIIHLNIDIPDSRFIVHLPPGTRVHNRISRYSYEVIPPELSSLDLNNFEKLGSFRESTPSSNGMASTRPGSGSAADNMSGSAPSQEASENSMSPFFSTPIGYMRSHLAWCIMICGFLGLGFVCVFLLRRKYGSTA